MQDKSKRPSTKRVIVGIVAVAIIVVTVITTVAGALMM